MTGVRRVLRLALAAAAGCLAIGADRPPGYIGGATVDLTAVLPPAPVKSDIRYAADRKVFKAMKRLIGSDRWHRAIADVDSTMPAVERDFACATGLPLAPGRFPALTRLLDNATADTARATSAAKQHWKRPRPFYIDKGETCEDKRALGNSYDHPSGHATSGWTDGLVLADLLPDRADAILARARAYGESRVLCRVHTMSAVESARLGATVTMATVRQSPGYLADLAAARVEMAAARADTASPAETGCAAEARALTPSVLAAIGR